jgi:hypothetical protein
LVLVASSVNAQSLGDLARKEEERRKASPPPATATKVYTNADLPRVPAPTITPVTGSAAPVSADPATADPAKPTTADAATSAAPTGATAQKPADAASGQKEPVKDQAYWSSRMSSLRQEQSRDQVFADALQSRINGLTTDFVNRDDPIQRSAIETDRQKAVSELGRLQKAMADRKKAIADLEEEARRAGVPPGWLR